MKKNSLLLILSMLPMIVCAQATDSTRRWTDNAMMIAIGAQNEFDTYLSSREYSGITARFVSHTVRHSDASSWSTRIVHQGSFFSGDLKQSSDGNEIGGIYNFQWGRQYQLPLHINHINVAIGATLDATAGFLYNTRNSNNPAQARLALNIAPVVSAQWHFSLWRKPLALGLELMSPLCGLMFSPNYGQSYYEIFNRGNYDHNCVPTTFISTPSLQTMLSLDIPIGRSALRIGYIGDIRQAKVNSIKQHSYSHYFMIGYVRSFSVIKRRVVSNDK